MNEWETLLRDGDPIAREPAMTDDEVERMRRHLLAAHVEPRPERLVARLALAATAALAALTATWWIHGAPRAPQERPSLQAADDANPVRRQLQFATPGGTRVIWIFDSNFDVR
jgi:hypothetical protein